MLKGCGILVHSMLKCSVMWLQAMLKFNEMLVWATLKCSEIYC